MITPRRPTLTTSGLTLILGAVVSIFSGLGTGVSCCGLPASLLATISSVGMIFCEPGPGLGPVSGIKTIYFTDVHLYIQALSTKKQWDLFDNNSNTLVQL